MEFNFSDTLDAIEEQCDWVNIANKSDGNMGYSTLIATKSETVIVVYILPIIMFLGISANMCFLIMMARFRHMRSTVNYYLASLAIADLFLLIIGGMEKLLCYYTASSIYTFPYHGPGASRFYCIFMPLIISTFFITSAFNITLVTLEMFFALCKPIEHRRISSKRRTFGLITLSWIAGLLVGFTSNLPFWTLYICIVWPYETPIDRYPLMVGVCLNRFSYYTFTKTAVEFVSYLIGLIVNCVLYICILYKLQKNQVASNRRNNLRAVSKMIVANGVAYFFCLTPFYGYKLVRAIELSNLNMAFSDNYHSVYIFSFLLVSINSTINPFIYGTFNARYRTALRNAFSCKVTE